MENIEVNLKKLYTFSGVPFSEQVKSHMNYLTHGNQNKETFFGVVRSQSFDYSHWTHQMNKEDIIEIEKLCQNFMTAVNYTSFQDMKKKLWNVAPKSFKINEGDSVRETLAISFDFFIINLNRFTMIQILS